MRIMGVVFIFVGLLLCLTFFGAIVGVPLILVGWVMVVMGGRKTVITNVVNVTNVPNTSPADQMSATMQVLPKEARAELEPPSFAPRLIVPSKVEMAEAAGSSEPAYDGAKWKALVEFDAEIEAAVRKVESYGQKYVDQLAAAYLALNDKQYLATVTEKIISRARQGA